MHQLATDGMARPTQVIANLETMTTAAAGRADAYAMQSHLLNH